MSVKKTALLALSVMMAFATVSGTWPAQPASAQQPSTIPPVEDHSDDDILQVNSLRVESVSSVTAPAVIVAVADAAATCKLFSSPSGSSQSCAPRPSVSYRIMVSAATRLLLRTRQSASLSDFAPGDVINVYGFRNPVAITQREPAVILEEIDALIVRNLSKPVRVRPVQLNSVEVIAEPSSLTPPASLVVLRNDSFPCLDFDGSSAGRPFPCPLGTDSLAPGAAQGLRIAPEFDRAQRKYIVNVAADTKILLRDRTPGTLADIKLSDRLNIYGTLESDNTTIRAQIIRDLSRPVQVTGVRLDAITPVSGKIGARVTLTGSGFVAGGGVKFGRGYLSPSSVSVDGTSLTFEVPEHLSACQPSAQYCIQIAIQVVPGNTYSVSFVNPAGQESNALKFAVTDGSQSGNQPPVMHGVSGPTMVRVGESGTWTVQASDPEGGLLSYSVQWGDEGSAEIQRGTPSAASDRLSQASFTHSYFAPGIYKPTFTVTDQFGLSASASMTVNVGSVIAGKPAIVALSPTSGRVGIPVTVSGRGFSSTGNQVNFGYGAIPNVPSADGTTLTFTVPNALTPGCYYSRPACLLPSIETIPGTYAVSVTNAIGTSNEIQFVVTSSATPIPTPPPAPADVKAYLSVPFQLGINQTAYILDYQSMRVTLLSTASVVCQYSLKTSSDCGSTVRLSVATGAGPAQEVSVPLYGSATVNGALITLQKFESANYTAHLTVTRAATTQ